MSRRRYITTDISRDMRVNQLAEIAGDFAVNLYTWMIPHAGDDGVIGGTAAEIMLLVVPARRDKSEADITEALAAMDQLGLVSWQPENRRVVFPTRSFYRYQTYIPEKKRPDGSPPENGAVRRTTPQEPPPDQESPQNADDHRESPQNASIRTLPSFVEPSLALPSQENLVAADSARAEETDADTSSSLFSLVCQSLRVDEGDDVDGLVRDGVSAFGSLRPELEAKRCRLHYPNWMRTPPAWRIGKFIEWMKREERYHAASNVRELPPPKEQPTAELTTYPPSGVELWDRLRVEFVKDNAINRLMCRRPTDWMFEELHALGFDGTTLRMATPWPPGHFREEWRGVIRNYCRRLQESPPEVEWVPETAEASA